VAAEQGLTMKLTTVSENVMKYVSYLRVSTADQAASGLGLEAQREAVRRYVEGRAGRPDGTATGIVVGPPLAIIPKENLILAEIEEQESGKRADRPKLAEAINLAKLTGATLIVAKLDRLSRSIHFITSLEEAKVKFVCADMPEANEMTIHIMAVMAQHERRMISERTKAALASVRARLAAGEPYVSRASGRLVTKLGNPNGAAALRRSTRPSGGGVARKMKADARAGDLRQTITRLRGSGATSLSALAAGLNGMGIEAPRGGVWHPKTVARVLERLTPVVPSSTHAAP
jgi:DNA invertase Pin-like site-specific DNA recombinase